MTEGPATQQSYLEAKRSVDDRALDRRVFERFAEELSSRPEPVRVLELGAGVGTMIARLVEWDSLPSRVSYRAVDRDPTSIERARELVPARLESAGYAVEWLESTSETVGNGVPRSKTLVAHSAADGDERRLEITLEVADAFNLEATADVIIAAALLDLFDLERAIPTLEASLVEGGLLYAPITYNGATAFAPRDPLDRRIESEYHRHMDEIRDGGGSRAGTVLLSTLEDREWDVLEAGSADWIVRPVDGRYPHDERRVIAHVLETIADALADVPASDLDADVRREWLERRRRALENQNLVFTAHNLDVVARYGD